LVVVVDGGVELLGELLELEPPLGPVVNPPEEEPLVDPVLGPPIELVPLVPLPAVLPVLGLVLDGLVLLLEEVEPVPELAPPVPAPLLQALRDSAAATVRVASATCEREVFMGKLLGL
jgi:hypothetical protein